jgi:Fe-Mn family superoxide dismutase
MVIYQRIKLPYKLESLEPFISSQTMYYHYEILHKNYEVKLNETLRGTGIEQKYSSLEELMKKVEQLPLEIQGDVRFFGGGLSNHNFFFAHLSKNDLKDERKINPSLLSLIREKFSTLENLKEELIKSALKIRGSGWTWLVLDEHNQLKIINTANQDSPWSWNLYPLIAIDVWEHAYFLDYGTNRKEYVEKLLKNLLNWDYISEVYNLRNNPRIE